MIPKNRIEVEVTVPEGYTGSLLNQHPVEVIYSGRRVQMSLSDELLLIPDRSKGSVIVRVESHPTETL